MNPTIVLGGGDINGLSVTRTLGQNGIDVYCVISDSDELVRYSKYCKESFVIPRVEEDPDQMKKFLQWFTQRFTGKAYLHPTSDLAVLSLSQIIDEVDDYVASIPPRETVETLVIKKKFYQSLAEWGIPHPITLYPDTESFTNIKCQIPFPVFIKPSISQRFNQRFGVKGFVAHNERELRKYLQLTNKYNIEVVIQQIILGPTTNHYSIIGYFNKESKPLLLVARRKIRQPTFFSVNSVIVTIPLSQVSEPVEIIVKYLSSLNYHGIFGCEIKQDSRDGKFRLLEVNARSGGSNSHMIASGINHILVAYREALGEEIPPLSNYKSGVYSINTLRDLRSIKRMLIEKRFSFRDIVSPYFGKKKLVLLSTNDPAPFILRIKGIYNDIMNSRAS